MVDLADLYVVTLARQMRDHDILHVGASQLEVWQAAEVAKQLWAPNLRVVAAGTYRLGSGRQTDTALMKSRTYARDVIAARQATFTQSRVFDDLLRSRVVFAGALQVDMAGNANLIGFTRDGKPVRGPGSGGLPTLTSHSERFFIALQRHTRHTLVGRVDRISVLGDRRARRELGLPDAALQQVITPLASFQATEDGLELLAYSPGTSAAGIQEQTGFPVRPAPGCGPRAPMTLAERNALAATRQGQDA